jgi:serine/threonine protein phosphatase PrpC
MGTVFVGSTTGESHQRSNRGNEDAYFVGQGPQGWNCIVVCDGCGSSKNAAAGAKATAELVGEALIRVSRKLSLQGEGDWVIDDVIIELAGCRNALRKRFGNNLLDYSATIVAAVHSPRGGFFLHVGDGLGIALKVEPSANEKLRLSATAISPPENGEYANQTFYLSETNWIRHFRLTPIPEGDVVFLMTDGIQDLIAPHQMPNSDQIADLLRKTLRPSRSPNESLEEFLLSDDAKRQSGDDKTLIALVNDSLTRSVQNRAKLEAGIEFAAGPNVSPAPEESLNRTGYNESISEQQGEQSQNRKHLPPTVLQTTKSDDYISRALGITSALSAAIGLLIGAGIGTVATNYFHRSDEAVVSVGPEAQKRSDQTLKTTHAGNPQTSEEGVRTRPATSGVDRYYYPSAE